MGGGGLSFLNKKSEFPLGGLCVACKDLRSSVTAAKALVQKHTAIVRHCGANARLLFFAAWHPARLDRQEEKWKKEQAALKEKQKAEELKKQILEEREREELDSLAHAAGVKE